MARDVAASVESVALCPVRHHSPAAARAVEATILARRPRLVLVEGPSDATGLIPLLLAADSRPPVAILAYRPIADDEAPRVVAVPFCDYSPELVALRAAARLGAAARFFDAPAAAFLDPPAPEAQRDGGAPAEAAERLPDVPLPQVLQSLAARFSFATHDEFWDSRIEMANTADVLALVGGYGDMVRGQPGERGFDAEREAWMLAEVERALGEGYRPEEIAVVCGAAHVGGLRSGGIDEAAVARLRGLPPASFALIPYSYPRLAEQSGYGAGNRAPAFYQELWRRGDWAATVLDFLLRCLSAMREGGHAVSLADSIEANRLAENLAGLRDKAAPGLEELRDAVAACYGKGGDAPGPFLERLLVGEEVGVVSAAVARTPLQREFHDGIRRHGIPYSDSARTVRLNLTNPGQRAASALLHRLGVAEVPFGRLDRSGSGTLNLRERDRRKVAEAEERDALDLLMVLREQWEVRWTPSTDVRLVELGVYGSTLAEVCGRLIRRRLAASPGLADAVRCLLDVVVGRLDDLYDETLAVCERISGADDDFTSLAPAAYLLDVLAGYADLAAKAESLARLGERVFARAALLIPRAAEVSDEEAARVGQGIRSLHSAAVRRRGRGLDTALLAERLGETAQGEGEVHPTLAGLALCHLYLDGAASDADLARALGLRLSRGEAPIRAAQFVEGLLSLNRSVVVRNRALVESLTNFLVGLEREAFLGCLPVLRRSLSGLSPSEMGYLTEAIAEVLGVGAARVDASALAESDLAALGALDAELGDLLK